VDPAAPAPGWDWSAGSGGTRLVVGVLAVVGKASKRDRREDPQPVDHVAGVKTPGTGRSVPLGRGELAIYRQRILGVRRASQAGNARRPLTVRDGCGPGLIVAVRQIAMAAHYDDSALVAGKVLQNAGVSGSV
jgi:hypothetical protein